MRKEADRMGDSRSRWRWPLAALGVCGIVWISPTTAGASTETFSFTPVADTHVDSSSPGQSFADLRSFWVDASPRKQSFMRFRLDGLEGRQVVGARLRMSQGDNSESGGRVFSISSTDWPEALTWNTRPAIDGPQLAIFGPVERGEVYEVELGPLTPSGGVVALGLDSTSKNGVKWYSREAGKSAPQLIVEVSDDEPPPPPPPVTIDGLSEIAAPTVGSSDPTYHSTQHRLAITSGDRLLALHGKHADGVQLAWRDPAGHWQTQTKGTVADGRLISGTGTGDWPASVALARDSAGVEHAWAVFARDSTVAGQRVYLRRLSDLDSPSGPHVGPLVVVDDAPMGTNRVDIQFEDTPGGPRGALVWSRRVSTGQYETVAGWLTDLDTDTPGINNASVLFTTASPSRWGTLVASANGMYVVARADSGSGGRLVLFSHARTAALDSWSRGPDGIVVAGYPSATDLDSGEILSAVESDLASNVVKVQRYSARGTAASVELTLTGYSTPTIASDGRNAWLVMVRNSDGYVVSRAFRPDAGWDGVDRVEIAGDGNHDYPNAIRRTDGRLRFIVRGPASPVHTSQTSVLAYQRGL